MRIRSSHLTLRFYLSDGWTKEILQGFLTRGEIELASSRFFEPDPYLRLNHQTGARFDAEKLEAFAGEILSYNGVPILNREMRVVYIQDNNW